MTELTTADRIWNRACGHEMFELEEGDVALMAMLLLHNLTMNGGVLHGVEASEPEDLADADWGYRYFGFDDVADLFLEAKSLIETGDDLEVWEAELNRRYWALVPVDSTLSERFEAYFRQNPSAFAPL